MIPKISDLRARYRPPDGILKFSHILNHFNSDLVGLPQKYAKARNSRINIDGDH